MENEPESQKKVYFTAISVVYLSTRLQARSLIASCKHPGHPFVEFDPQRHVGYFAFDADERKAQLQGSDWPDGR
jgi:hypothetical protein